LALFGRRPPQLVDSLVMPASENLHNNGLLHRNKTRAQPITLSVRASTIGSVEPCYSIRIARRFIPLVL
jgi:hypothetical protein